MERSVSTVIPGRTPPMLPTSTRSSGLRNMADTATPATTSMRWSPLAGHLWDLAQRKGLTYRSYGENAARASTGTTMDAAPGAGGLVGHVSADYLGSRQRDTANIGVFLREFRDYEKNYDSADPNKRFPN